MNSVQDALSSVVAAESQRVLALTRRLSRGDEDAFREFHARYFDRLFQFLLVVARGREHEAEEALQETMLRVARYARAFATEEAFWGWLKVVARSAARDAGRKQTRHFNLLRRFALHWELARAHDEISDENSLQGLVEEGLGKLDHEDRRLIEGKYLEGSSVKDLARVTGLTDKAVESRLLRARRAIRDFICKRLDSQ